MSPIHHQPVMVEEAMTLLAPERGGLFVDCTVGLGGHAEALLSRNSEARLLGLDRDPQALAIAEQRLRPFGSRVRLVQARFSELEAVLGDERLEGGALADLGVSSLQLELGERGFSLQQEGPLDMRMSGGSETAAVADDDTSVSEKGIDTGGGEEVSAFDLVNEAPEGQLQQIFSEYGEERMARRIAQTIAAARAQRPVRTTRELRELVYRAKGGRRKEGRIDSATRVFQALRIAVNEELQELERLLGESVRLMRPDGRLVVISYHSLEDRLVKHRLRAWADPLRDPTTGRQREEERLVELLTRKALRPSAEEIAINPRARSARLRAARKLV
ncbi:MAG TPA: 16S rRNA (cytosine(1402)-N(4))-methyltransferase RsmH [Thermoanaerobaculia bacterium]|nr:16S rRNA (cytosine(1402)-N(4))-methyltransferase RsmH [Thermoanaerobaculia bacterium]